MMRGNGAGDAVSGIPRIVSLVLSPDYRISPSCRSCSSHIGVSSS